MAEWWDAMDVVGRVFSCLFVVALIATLVINVVDFRRKWLDRKL